MTHSPLNVGAFAAPSHVTISPMYASDDARVQALQAEVFGPGRFARTAFRLRETAAPLLPLSLIAEESDQLIGAVSMSRIMVGAVRGVLLGPLAVLPDKRDLGIGKALLAKSVAKAFDAGELFVLLVGDLPYYAPVGFKTGAIGTMTTPGPVDPSRLLIAMNPEHSSSPSGAVRGAAD